MEQTLSQVKLQLFVFVKEFAMQVMNRQEAELLDMLIQLANGDTKLVDTAIQKHANAEGISHLDDVISYIEENRDQEKSVA